jgi:hypothetical protein
MLLLLLLLLYLTSPAFVLTTLPPTPPCICERVRAYIEATGKARQRQLASQKTQEIWL